MRGTFRSAGVFNQDIGDWNVSSVLNMEQMFNSAHTFNQDLNWDVSSVTDMENMFNGADSFDQDLGSWDVSSVTNMNYMLSGTAISTDNYDGTLNGWAEQDVQSGVTFVADPAIFCSSQFTRQHLIDEHG